MTQLLFSVITDLNLSGLPKPAADSNAVGTVLSIVIGIIAALSLLFITIGGFRYILSQGDPQAVSKAKGTILYALIGLLVSILAQVIVLFVLKAVQ